MTKLAIIVGHKKGAQGAYNKDYKVSEFIFNNHLADVIANKIKKEYADLEPIIVYRDTYNGLPGKVNKTGADIALSLHCNAFNGKASGCEVLYHHTSSNGKKLADILCENITNVLENNNRGSKPIDYSHVGSKGDRGGWLVEKTKMPCVIIEPFFIDNDAELINAQTKLESLAEAYIKSVIEYLN